MGQKINPIGFRLGTTQGHHSLWFAQPKNYSEGLQEDQKIRNYIKNYPTPRIEELQMNLQKEFNSVNRKLNIAITRIEKPYGNPNILAEFIAAN
ncbi:hypothetical protein OSB04_un001237 [Centaurea solstitialis]|uniref:Ribosomal protein S3 n=1 Tax=Centaurea solstitialis TaxID=347529 RepID=A0AA38SB45_9ASTR|nr:hypothetical protein OSB04_un001237 [Centaurea solstitialis]